MRDGSKRYLLRKTQLAGLYSKLIDIEQPHKEVIGRSNFNYPDEACGEVEMEKHR